VILGDGSRLFDEMGEHKLRMAGAQFRLHLTVEFPHGQAPNGCSDQWTSGSAHHHQRRKCRARRSTALPPPGWRSSVLGFEAPSLFIAARASHAATNTTLWTLPIDEPAVQSWSAAVAAVTPFLQGWLGQRPRSQLTILDLPDPDDTPFETGAMLATSTREAPPSGCRTFWPMR
jgi:hypothetical protein